MDIRFGMFLYILLNIYTCQTEFAHWREKALSPSLRVAEDKDIIQLDMKEIVLGEGSSSANDMFSNEMPAKQLTYLCYGIVRAGDVLCYWNNGFYASKCIVSLSDNFCLSSDLCVYNPRL